METFDIHFVYFEHLLHKSSSNSVYLHSVLFSWSQKRHYARTPCICFVFSRYVTSSMFHSLKSPRALYTSMYSIQYIVLYVIVHIREEAFLSKWSDQKVHLHKCVVWSPGLKNNFGFQIGQPIILHRPFKDLAEATIEAKIEGCPIFGKFSPDHR